MCDIRVRFPIDDILLPYMLIAIYVTTTVESNNVFLEEKRDVLLFFNQPLGTALLLYRDRRFTTLSPENAFYIFNQQIYFII